MKSLKPASKHTTTKRRMRNSDCELVLKYDNKNFFKEIQNLNSGKTAKTN